MLFSLAAAVAGSAGTILTDIIASRLGASRVKAYAASLLCGLVVTILVLVVAVKTAVAVDFSDVILAFLLFCAWWFILLNFIQSFDSSLRIRLLKIVTDSGGRLSRAELFQHYNDQVLLELRLARLLAQGYVIERGGRLFVVSKQLRLVGHFFRALKLALLGRRSEFDRPTKSSRDDGGVSVTGLQ